jgi:hypothetical protein
MRSHMQCLTAALLLCFVLVSGSGAWALPVHASAPVPKPEVSVMDALRDWAGSLLAHLGLLPHGTTPEPPRSQPKEGSQMDPNGSTGPH